MTTGEFAREEGDNLSNTAANRRRRIIDEAFVGIQAGAMDLEPLPDPVGAWAKRVRLQARTYCQVWTSSGEAA